ILRDKAFHNMDAAMYDAVVEVHLRGALNLTQPAFKIMRDKGYGRIVSTSSGAGVFGNFGQANYGAAKMGLVGLTRVLAVEGARNNVRANAIAPIALTRMTEDLLGDLGQKLQPEYVSPLVTYLAHESCEASGRLFSVGGGRVAEVFIGECDGYTSPTLSPEEVRDNWSQITDREGYTVPAHSRVLPPTLRCWPGRIDVSARWST
ncbi:MAG: SDR family NAD(P)-dependent oxidoreductase, partial [bacterium]